MELFDNTLDITDVESHSAGWPLATPGSEVSRSMYATWSYGLARDRLRPCPLLRIGWPWRIHGILSIAVVYVQDSC